MRSNNQQDSRSPYDIIGRFEQLKQQQGGRGPSGPEYNSPYQSNPAYQGRNDYPSDNYNQPQYGGLQGSGQKPPIGRNISRSELPNQYNRENPAFLNERNQPDAREDPYQKGNSNQNPRDNSGNNGSFWDNLGDNPRKKAMEDEFKEYLKGRNAVQMKKIEETQQQRGQNHGYVRKKHDSDSSNVKDAWQMQNVNVGILPGLGKAPEDRRNDAFRRTPEVKPLQERYLPDTIDPPNYGRALSQQAGNASGSRLAGIGSRIVDFDRPYYDDQRGYGADQPRLGGDFVTPNNNRRDFMSGLQDFRTPQYGMNREPISFNTPAPQSNMGLNFGSGGKNQNNVDNFKDWKDNVLSSGWQDQGNAGGRSNSRGRAGRQEDQGGNAKGGGWLEQRQREEEDKRQKQKDDLQRVYREQIEEKKRRKDEEKMRQKLEDQKEDERLRKETEELQRQFLLEQQKKKGAAEQMNNPPPPVVRREEPPQEDFITGMGRRGKVERQNKAFEMSEANTMKRELYRGASYQEEFKPAELKLEYKPPEMLEYRRVGEGLVKDTANRLELELRNKQRFEIPTDPEIEVQRQITKKMDYTLHETLDKMKKDLEYHSNIIKNELSGYKTQAIASQELRQKAQNDLLRLKDDLKNQQYQQFKPYESFEPLPEREGSYASYAPQNQALSLKTKSQSEKVGLRIPAKNYAKSIIPEEEGPDLGSSTAGLNLEVETHYVPIRETEGYKSFNDPPKLGGMMNKYGIETRKEDEQARDAAMEKFGMLFPDHKKAPENKSIGNVEAKVDTGLRRGTKGETQETDLAGKNVFKVKQGVREDAGEDDLEEVEGADEIERIDNLLKRYKGQETKKKDKESERAESIQREEAIDQEKGEEIEQGDEDEFQAEAGEKSEENSPAAAKIEIIQSKPELLQNSEGNELDELNADDFALDDIEDGEEEEATNRSKGEEK